MRCKTVAGDEWIYLTRADLLRLLGAFDPPEGTRVLSVPGVPYFVATDLKTADSLMLKSEREAVKECRPQTPESPQIAGARLQEPASSAGDPFPLAGAGAALDATVATGAGPAIDTCANVRPFVASTPH